MISKNTPDIALGAVLAAGVVTFGAAAAAQTVRVERLADAPIIGPELHPSIGENIQGPSLIRVPDWVADPLGAYYLYFATTRDATSGSPTPMTCGGRGGSTRRAACRSPTRTS